MKIWIKNVPCDIINATETRNINVVGHFGLLTQTACKAESKHRTGHIRLAKAVIDLGTQE
jgi:hypothetical protein